VAALARRRALRARAHRRPGRPDRGGRGTSRGRRGGEGIPALSAQRARLSSALAALVLGAALAAYPALAAPRLKGLELALGGAALLALALALALPARSPLLGASLVLLAAEIVALDLLRTRSPLALVVCAAGLLTLGELAALSVSLRAVELVSRTVALRRTAYLAAVALGAAAVAAVVELATRIAIGGGLGSAALGVGAIVLLLGATSGLARARGRRSAGD
jgi:hypothetical protein